VFKFLDLGTKAIEAETGFSANEPVNYATRAAIEAGVIEIVKQGEVKGYWKSQKPVVENIKINPQMDLETKTTVRSDLDE
jgi:curli biogenesis system outer membrane secretion channel CsgG